MASPPPGMTPAQTQQWSNNFQAGLKKQGQDPAMFGFGSQAPRPQTSFQAPMGGGPAYKPPKQAGFQAYAAQSIPFQSQGTPYAPKSVGTSAPLGSPQNPIVNNFTGTQGNLAYAPPDQRPPPFQQVVRDASGQQVDPAQMTNRRDAFIQAFNDWKAPHAQAFGMSGTPIPKTPVDQLWKQADEMVQGGWTNPFAAQPTTPQGQGTPYGQPATLMVGEYGQPPAQMPVTMAQIASEGWQPPAQMPVRPEFQTLAVGEDSYGPGRPPAQPVQQQSQGTPYGQPATLMVGEYGQPPAQPVQQQSQGTPYGQPATRPVGGPGAAQPVQPPSQGTLYGTPPDQRGAAPTFGVFAPGSLTPQPTPATREGVDANGIYMDPKFRAEKEAADKRAAEVAQQQAAAWAAESPRWQQLQDLINKAESYERANKGKLVRNAQGIWVKNPYDSAIRALVYGQNAIPGAQNWYESRSQARMQGLPAHKFKAPTSWGEMNDWTTNAKAERDRIHFSNLAWKHRPQPTPAQQAAKNAAWEKAKHADRMQETAGWQKSASPTLKWNK